MVSAVEAPTKSNTGAASRLSIVRTTTEKFALTGYAGGRTKGIAHAADVKRKLLFYYFKTKEQLHCEELKTVVFNWVERVLDKKMRSSYTKSCGIRVLSPPLRMSHFT